MIAVYETPVDLPHQALSEADWGDAFSVTISNPFENAKAAALAAFDTFPPWVYALMAIRNAVVAPFGLKTGANRKDDIERIGFFPLIAEREDQLVVGMNDRHLDFRCVVDLEAAGEGQRVTITTVLKRHNRLGRAYLAVIMPFHKAILRVAMKRLAKHSARMTP